MSNANVAGVRPARGRDPALAPRVGSIAPGVIVLLLGISYSFNGLDRQVFPALLGPIRQQYALTLAEGGLLSTSFAATIAVFGALSHWFVARFGRKRVLVGGLAFYSLFTALTPLAPDFWTLLCFRTLTGAGEALHIASIFAMIGAYFGPRRGTYLGIINAFFGIGAFLGPLLGTRLYAATGSWEEIFYLYGLLGFAAAASIAVLVPRAFASAVDPEQAAAGEPSAAAPKLLNRNSALCLVAFGLIGYTFFSYTALYTLFLQTAHAYDVVTAGQCFGMFGVGALAACVAGWVGERTGQAGLLVALGALGAVGYFLFHHVADPVAQAGLSLLYGALASGYLFPRFIALIQRSVASHQISLAMALAIPVFYATGTFAGFAFGHLVGVLGWSTAALLSVAVPPVLALGLSTLLKPRLMRGG